MKETIRDFRGIILGFVYTDKEGNKKVTNEKGIILGFYKKAQNVTTNVRGVILNRGDTAVSLIYR